MTARQIVVALVGAVLFAGAASCGGSDTCEPRTGVYAITTTRVSGNCAETGSYFVEYRNGSEVITDPSCRYVSQRWLPDMCTESSEIVCERPADDMKSVGRGSSTQPDPDDPSFTGNVTMRATRLSTAELICQAEYTFTATRQ